MTPLLLAAVANQANVSRRFAQHVIDGFILGCDTAQAVMAYHRMTGELMHESHAYAVLAAWRQLRPEKAA